MTITRIGGFVARIGPAIALAAAIVAGQAAAAAQPVADTASGPVRGAMVEGVEAFRGVPYAAAPTGARRFAPPQPAAAWTAPLDATQRSRPCAQLASSNGPETLNEDCLTLDVWRPAGAKAGDKRPVLLFIHGGGSVNGAAAQHHPSRMASRTGIVVVNINYRLGALGMLALPALDREAGGDASGNAGYLDQLAALKWVRANIARFGGDPARITVGGESAGGWAACLALASPEFAGLISGVIVQSGGCASRPRETALAEGAAFASSLGCSDAATAADCLRGKDAAALLNAWRSPAVPVIGGRLLPAEPASEIAAGRFNRVPVIWGHTYNEGSFGLIGDDARLTKDALAARVTERFGAAAPGVLKAYASAPTPGWAWTLMSVDPGLCQGSAGFVRVLAQSAPVWFYEFDDQDAPGETGWPEGTRIGAYHSSELLYLYGMDRSDGSAKQSRGLTPTQQALGDEMIGAWAAFAAKGDPNGAGLKRWPRFDAERPALIRFRPGETGAIRLERFDADHRCAVWRELAP
jgi:para-nitrobenzyl esterase